VHSAKGVAHIDKLGNGHIAGGDVGTATGSLKGMTTEAAAKVKKFVARF